MSKAIPDSTAVSKAYSWNLRIFAIFGFWGLHFREQWQSHLFILYRMTLWTIMTVFALLLYVDLYFVWGDVETMNYNLCTTITMSLIYVKTMIVQGRTAKIERLRHFLDNNLYLDHVGRSVEDLRVLAHHARHITNITKVFYSLAIPTGTSWVLMPLLDTKNPRRLPFRTWLPEDFKETPIYQLVYAWHVALLPFLIVLIVSSDLIFCGFLIQIAGQYSVLEKNIQIVGESFGRKVQYALPPSMHHNIAHHQAIIKAVNEVEETYNFPIMLHLASASSLLGVIGFDLLMVSRDFNSQQFTQLCYVTTALLDVFFYCIFGTIIEHKSYSIAEAAYSSPWHRASAGERRDLARVMLRAQRAPMVTGGKLFYVRLSTYISIMRLAYNMLAVMREVAKH